MEQDKEDTLKSKRDEQGIVQPGILPVFDAEKTSIVRKKPAEIWMKSKSRMPVSEKKLSI